MSGGVWGRVQGGPTVCEAPVGSRRDKKPRHVLSISVWLPNLLVVRGNAAVGRKPTWNPHGAASCGFRHPAALRDGGATRPAIRSLNNCISPRLGDAPPGEKLREKLGATHLMASRKRLVRPRLRNCGRHSCLPPLMGGPRFPAILLRPLPGSRLDDANVFRGCRFAQPPANRYDPCRGQTSSSRF